MLDWSGSNQWVSLVKGMRMQGIPSGMNRIDVIHMAIDATCNQMKETPIIVSASTVGQIPHTSPTEWLTSPPLSPPSPPPTNTSDSTPLPWAH